MAKQSKIVPNTYAASGVDTSVAAAAKKRIVDLAKKATRPEVLGGIGFFGGMFEFKGYRNPVLVSSVDSVGTKIKIAVAMDKHDTVGIDIVNHCINDIFTGGAEPLFFLDYIATANLVPERIESIVSGLSKACREANCALIGGETASLPGIYSGDDYDLVGCIVGVVQKNKILIGQDIKAGDAVIGLSSNGLHTNGYSLARRVLGDTRAKLNVRYAELGQTVGEALLKPHLSYYQMLKPLLPQIKGMAHITGSGMVGNIPRTLPKKMAVRLDSRSWTVPPIFRLIEKKGNVEKKEMYEVFNMGIGMVAICNPEKAKSIIKHLPAASIIGEVVKQTGDARVIIDDVGYRHDKV